MAASLLMNANTMYVLLPLSLTASCGAIAEALHV